MGTHDEMSRDAVLSAVANAAREMVRLGYSVTDDLREALDRMEWREWTEESEGPTEARDGV